MTCEEECENLNVGKIYILRSASGGEKEGEEIVETVQKTVHKLPEILKKKDGIFAMKNRVEDIAIYQKIASFDGNLLYNHFEVIKIKVVCIRNKVTKEILFFKEIYPRFEEVGVYRWIFHNKNSARTKVNFLLKKEREKFEKYD